MTLRFAHRWAAVAAAGLLLTGCGLSDPGTAATVDGEPISVSDVQRYTTGYCSLVAPQVATGQQQVQSLADRKRLVVQTLVVADAAQQAVADAGLTVPGTVTQFLQSGAGPALEQISDEQDREAAGDYLRVFSEAQAALATLAADASGQEVGPDNLDQLLQVGTQQVLPQLLESADVSVDPRYGLGDDVLAVQGGDGSVSEPVSDLAVQLTGTGQDAPPSAASLPPDQRCGG